MDADKFVLRENETLIGGALVHDFHSRCNEMLYITNQRICLEGRILHYLDLDLPLSCVEGYDTGRILLFTSYLSIYHKNGREYRFSGLYIKNIPEWLEQAGIHRRM